MASAQELKRYRANLVDELHSAALYETLSHVEGSSSRKQVFIELARRSANMRACGPRSCGPTEFKSPKAEIISAKRREVFVCLRGTYQIPERASLQKPTTIAARRCGSHSSASHPFRVEKFRGSRYGKKKPDIAVGPKGTVSLTGKNGIGIRVTTSPG